MVGSLVSAQLCRRDYRSHLQQIQVTSLFFDIFCNAHHSSLRFSDQFQDLQPRVFKTYIDALAADKSLVTVYGGIVGLTALGQSVVQSILVRDHLMQIHNRLLVFPSAKSSSSSSGSGAVAIKSEGESAKRVKVERANIEEVLSPKQQAAAKEHGLNVEMCKAALLKSLGECARASFCSRV